VHSATCSDSWTGTGPSNCSPGSSAPPRPPVSPSSSRAFTTSPRFPTPLRRHLAGTVDGLLAAIRDDQESALDLLGQALRGWHDFGSRVEAAFTELDLARSLSVLGDPASEKALSHAREECAAIGLAVS
jgi:hypothetical protein